jgi:hypothetical protein
MCETTKVFAGGIQAKEINHYNVLLKRGKDKDGPSIVGCNGTR